MSEGSLLLQIVLPLRAPLLTQNSQRGMHWATVRKLKADLELIVGAACNKADLKQIEGPVSFRLIWYAPDNTTRDTDGLAAMAKGCLDALVKKGILKDDNCRIVTETILGPIVIARDNPRFEVQLRRVAGGSVVCAD